MRKKVLFALILIFIPLSLWAQMNGNLGNPSYMLEVDSLFPSESQTRSDNGIDNVSDFVTDIVPLLTTMMAIGATLMVILG
jgi:hypothetical protein